MMMTISMTISMTTMTFCLPLLSRDHLHPVDVVVIFSASRPALGIAKMNWVTTLTVLCAMLDKTMKSKEKSSVIDSLDDEVTGGIWDTPDEEDIDRPTFLRRRQRRKNKAARKQARAEAKRRKRK